MPENSYYSSPYQTTVAGKISCSGVGLHSGQPVRLTLYPAEADTGIQFVRLDVEEKKSFITANYLNVTGTTLGTTITNEYGVSVSTIEHLMAALWGMGVDNVIIAMDAAEVPIMDGSSEPFVFMIECAGLKKLRARRDFIEVLDKVTVKEGSSTAFISPLDGFTLDIAIDYPNTVIPRQHACYDFGEQGFKHLLCRARTFGFAADVEKLQAAGLARGGSLDNAIVISDKTVLNEGGLRYSDEFVRHKALDCVGDYFLAGYRIRGMVSTNRPGHALNNKLMRALLGNREAWRLTSSSQIRKSKFFLPAHQVA